MQQTTPPRRRLKLPLTESDWLRTVLPRRPSLVVLPGVDAGNTPWTAKGYIDQVRQKALLDLEEGLRQFWPAANAGAGALGGMTAGQALMQVLGERLRRARLFLSSGDAEEAMDVWASVCKVLSLSLSRPCTDALSVGRARAAQRQVRMSEQSAFCARAAGAQRACGTRAHEHLRSIVVSWSNEADTRSSLAGL